MITSSSNCFWVTVRNTFIHVVDVTGSEELPRLSRCASDPGLLGHCAAPLEANCGSNGRLYHAALVSEESRDINGAETPMEDGLSSGSLLHKMTPSMDAMEETHNSGLCRPCIYFCFKPDGCRMGNSCTFCHLCTADEVKERKRMWRQHAKLKKQQEMAAAMQPHR
eukprot:TRINITY_DN106380_c0_g1_i1.p1 TRINITY_DN106380_c0_g1~~TRINITY_DN106380_c0_g1_i1.p1  ORF type:complete len:192 (+),score=28.55 TRINITY_DN106380_c0_g1_i1:81-578(+)